MSAFLIEVEEILKSAPVPTSVGYFDLQSYIGTQLKVLGIKSADQRNISKQGFSFSSLAPQQQYSIWYEVWNGASFFETRQQCIYFLERNYKKFDPIWLWNKLQLWMPGIDNWAVSDGFSAVCGKAMKKNSDILLKDLIKLNQSENLWERRQSLVIPISHYKNAVMRPLVFEALELAENLIDDKEYFVQKALGWLLRELGVMFPQELELFLININEKLSPVAFTSATEKLSATLKEDLKLKRKMHRSRKK